MTYQGWSANQIIQVLGDKKYTYMSRIPPPSILFTLPETNISNEIPIFPGKYHQNGGFSMAMLVYRSVTLQKSTAKNRKKVVLGRQPPFFGSLALFAGTKCH